MNYVTLDNSGNLGFNSAGFTGSNAIVLATTPTITNPIINFPSGTLSDYADDVYTPIFTFISGSGTISLSSGVSARFRRTGNNVDVYMKLQYTIASSSNVTVTLPFLPNNNWTSTASNSTFNVVANTNPLVTVGAKTITLTGISGTVTFSPLIINYIINN